MHRSLNLKAPIRVFIFDNRVEIHSPGELPNGLTVDDIVKGTSMPRNQFLFTNANYLLPYSGAGSGILRALEEGLEVTFKNEERIHEFVIIIKREPKANNQEGIQEMNQESVQEGNQESNQESNQEKIRKSALTKAQRDVVNYCSVPRTAQEILARLGLSNQSINRKRHIQTLVDMGVLEMTIPEKPNDRNQKYRKRKNRWDPVFELIASMNEEESDKTTLKTENQNRNEEHRRQIIVFIADNMNLMRNS